jgi:hypoxia up-regulated 1
MRSLRCWALVSLLAFVPRDVLASVLAIDYGSEWIKASLMKPGVPFDVLLNKDSKRKIQSAVGWKQGDRLFGGDAANMVRDAIHSFINIILMEWMDRRPGTPTTCSRL